MSLGAAVPTRVAKLALDPVIQHIDGTFKHLSDDALSGWAFQSAVDEYAAQQGVTFEHPADVVAAVCLLRARRREASQKTAAAPAVLAEVRSA